MGEAMASGLVPVANDVMAIPEFVRRDWGVLGRNDDPASIATCLKGLVESPERFLELSAEVSKSIIEQCGHEHISRLEMDAVNSV
jgi:glycosyltransferase involved in cell wall biosynthesis